jgi:hypothetical protein
LDDLIPDEDIRSQVSEYVKQVEEKRAAISVEVEKVITLGWKPQTNSQEMSSPPPENNRKRSRSPTPSDDSSNKKIISEASKSPTIPKPAALTEPAVPAGPNNQFDPFSQQFNGMPPFMPPMPGMPFPPFPPDPFMMAAMGFPPPMPGMMMPMGNAMYPQQGYNQQMMGNQMGYNNRGQMGNQGGRQMYGSNNSAYLRGPVNERGMRRVQRGNNENGRNQADYKELI